MIAERPFWLYKTLQQMSEEEWELLCDGCGLCCMVRLEDEDTGEIALTRLSCRYLDLASCRCTDYANRERNVPACKKLTPAMTRETSWLPSSCAYRLVDEGKPLPPWHPLLSYDGESVHKAGISLKGQAISEMDIPEEDWEDYII